MDIGPTIEAEVLHAKFYYASEVPRLDCSPGEKRVGHWGVQFFEVGLEGAPLFSETRVPELPLRRAGFIRQGWPCLSNLQGFDVSLKTQRPRSNLPRSFGNTLIWVVE